MEIKKEVLDWVNSVADYTKPDKIHWMDGSDSEFNSIMEKMLKDGTMEKLNASYKNCYLHRSHQNDVARSEARTFICSETKEDAGPLNNWLPPAEGKTIYNKLFVGCMKNRTMYVIPYVMGPIDSPYSQAGVQVTDSPYVCVNLKIMTRIGKKAMEKIKSGFVRGIHATGSLNPEERYIMHFPSEKLIISINSNYGGNALLSKKCHALRIASTMAKSEGWLAEHMLILEVENPHGKKYYFAAAFPSASGKTNLAMINPPSEYSGWKARLIGDDIAWLHLGKDGRLYAINPEYGFFGVAPGTNEKTNPNAMETIKKNTLFTNVAVTKDGMPWWEGIEPVSEVTDWTGKKMDPKDGKAAHPNSRFTTPIIQYPHLSSHYEDPQGVPITAFIFGGRRESLIPLVCESFDWEHGVFMGATMGVEQTAAAEGKVGEIRRDPMAMRPFCAYHISDYFEHWLSFGKKSTQLPKIFYVNWFRKENGKFLWPGYGDNFRVLEWIIERCEGRGEAVKTPIGNVPQKDAIGGNVPNDAMEKLLHVDAGGWKREMEDVERFFSSLGRVPGPLKKRLEVIKKAL